MEKLLYSKTCQHICLFLVTKIVIRKKLSLTSKSNTLKGLKRHCLKQSDGRVVVITRRTILKVFCSLLLHECVASENKETFELCLDENASRVLHLPRDALKVATLQACACVFQLHVKLTLTGKMKMHERKFLMSKGKKY